MKNVFTSVKIAIVTSEKSQSKKLSLAIKERRRNSKIKAFKTENRDGKN